MSCLQHAVIFSNIYPVEFQTNCSQKMHFTYFIGTNIIWNKKTTKQNALYFSDWWVPDSLSTAYKSSNFLTSSQEYDPAHFFLVFCSCCRFLQSILSGNRSIFPSGQKTILLLSRGNVISFVSGFRVLSSFPSIFFWEIIVCHCFKTLKLVPYIAHTEILVEPSFGQNSLLEVKSVKQNQT